MNGIERASCFSGRNVPSGNSCSISSMPSLIPVSGLRRRFSVNKTDQSRAFPLLEMCETIALHHNMAS